MIGERQPLEFSTLEPLMQGARGQQQKELRLGSLLGIEETEDTFLTWLEAYKLDAKKIDVTSRWRRKYVIRITRKTIVYMDFLPELA